MTVVRGSISTVCTEPIHGQGAPELISDRQYQGWRQPGASRAIAELKDGSATPRPRRQRQRKLEKCTPDLLQVQVPETAPQTDRQTQRGCRTRSTKIRSGREIHPSRVTAVRRLKSCSSAWLLPKVHNSSPGSECLANLQATVQQADLLDWSLDFSAHIHADIGNNAFDETIFSDSGGQDSGALPESEAFSFLDSDDMGSGPTAQEIGSTTDRLLQLQIQLHHLSVTTDQATAMNKPAAEEVLEATKSFLEILQASLAAQSCIPQPTSAIASTADALTGWDDPNPAAMSYITVLQVLTCYSYVLHVLDPVVSALIIQKAESTVGTAVPCRAFSNAGLEKSSQTALTMGFFNLASQPAMNADVVLHIILRMIQQLRVSIHLLASGHRDLVGEISDRVGIGSPAVDTTRKLHATPISISSQPIVKLISAREEPLVERLSHLINGQ